MQNQFPVTNFTLQLFGFLVAGHDTTSATMSWGVKLLAHHPAAQSRLRKSLRSAFSNAIAGDRLPSVREITGTSVPYLDAAIEEILRVKGPAPVNSREATQDTFLMGHRIPKGTLVMYLQNGPSFMMPAHETEETRPRQHSQDDKNQRRHRAWSDDDIASFKPERWLVETQATDTDGETAFNFNGSAGPTHPFGLGPRSCFGRRLAYLELRIMLTLLIWNFDLLECPAELSSWNGKSGIVYKPIQCFVRLKKVDESSNIQD